MQQGRHLSRVSSRGTRRRLSLSPQQNVGRGFSEDEVEQEGN
jgi:hypothetical protein